MHLKSVVNDGELEEPATGKEFLVVQVESFAAGEIDLSQLSRHGGAKG